MLRVTIELISAVTKKTTELGKMYICNVGGDKAKGNYHAAVLRKGSNIFPFNADGSLNGTQSRASLVTDYPRESYNVWRLIMRSLRGAFPEETGKGDGQIPDDVAAGFRKMAESNDPEIRAAVAWVVESWGPP